MPALPFPSDSIDFNVGKGGGNRDAVYANAIARANGRQQGGFMGGDDFAMFPGMFSALGGIGTMNNLNGLVGNQWARRAPGGYGGYGYGGVQGQAIQAGTGLQLEAMRQSNQNQRLNAVLPALLAAFANVRQPQVGMGWTAPQNPQPMA